MFFLQSGEFNAAEGSNMFFDENNMKLYVTGGGSYRNMKTLGLASELFQLSLEPAGGVRRNLNISDVRMINKSDGKGATYNLGRYKAASFTHMRANKKGEKILGLQHSGMYCTGSGLNGTLTQDITIVKLQISAKTTTAVFTTVRAETEDLPHSFDGELLQRGTVPPALIGHQLTLIKPAKNGRCQAVLRFT